MKEFQRMQEEAKLKAMKDEEERIRLEEEMAKKREEQERLEKERRENKKRKEKDRINRKKEEGTYLTKEQREKLERARVQLEAAGIQVPARHTVQKSATNDEQTGQTVKKRVLYDDRRKKGKAVAQREFLRIRSRRSLRSLVLQKERRTLGPRKPSRRPSKRIKKSQKKSS